MSQYYVSMYQSYKMKKAYPTILEVDLDKVTGVLHDPSKSWYVGKEIVFPKENLYTKNEAIKQVFEREWLF